MIPVGDLMVARGGSVNPLQFPDEEFDLYSIPAFDAGQPEIALGAEIGSTKQIVQPNDVLLSKIVPHIRRAWVVGDDRGRRLIGSGEWIVFRSEKVFPRYLRHVLVGDPFHQQFMQTVSGVGGSLLRARPAFVASIQIPLPPLDEQRRIAAILDQAETLRTQRRAALALLDRLTQSLFLDMFGDPVANPKGFQRQKLGELISTGPQNGLYKSSTEYGSGTPILRIDAFYDGVVTKLNSLKRVRLSPDEVTTFGLAAEDIVINRVNSIEYLGKSALIPTLSEPTVFESNMMRFTVRRELLDPGYVVHFLQTPFIKSQILAGSKNAVNQSSINQQDVKGFQINVPPLSLQQTFATRIQVIEALKATHRQALAALDALFASLQQRAFAGQL